jgi:wobble nucleotide-excising tRNase
MITKIFLKKVASYGENPVIIETDKKINLIYGLNGTGKTTISKYLQNQNDSDFLNCSIDGLSNEKILVYNQKFIDENFYLSPTQKGIFSLKSENKEAKEKIDNATEEIKKLDTQIKNNELKTGLYFDLQKKQNDIENLQNSAEEKTWEIKTKYSGGDRILEFCLDGKKGSKKDLFDHISTIQKSNDRPEKTISDLKKEAEATQGTNAKIYDENLIIKIEFDFWKIEEQEIFKEVIVGNENSQVAELINNLNNSDWVKDGRKFTQEPDAENETCPFCQQKTITKILYQEIQGYFDETYQQKIKELEVLDKEYFNKYQIVKNLEDKLLQIDFIKNKETEFKLLFKNFIDKLSSNRAEINKKIKSPNITITLDSSILEQKALNDFLDTIIEETKTHNKKINNKQNTKNQIIKDFWEIMRWEYDQTIENYSTQKSRLKIEKSNIENKESQVKTKIQDQKNIIRESQKEMVNVQDAIDNINSELILFGLDGFSIVPAGEQTYKLNRPNEDNTKFETLSEGEKTVISFLYFLELCKGKENNEEVATEKIVVIDDPISSLSHMFVFNVAQLIRKCFFNDEYKQVFILTHNLYLFHELIKYTEKNKKKDREKLFRITKNNEKESIIFEMNKDEVLNDYQSYWQVIKEHDQKKASDSLLANSMRNILEYFFGFIDNERYENAVENLTDGKYSYFLRYINRESHFDRINISDTKEIDPQIFKEAFKKIFEDSGYIEHYNKMMEIMTE